MLARVPLLVRLLWPYASLLVSAVLTRVLVARSIATLSILSLASQSFQHVLQPMLLLMRTMESILQTPSGCGSTRRVCPLYCSHCSACCSQVGCRALGHFDLILPWT